MVASRSLLLVLVILGDVVVVLEPGVVVLLVVSGLWVVDLGFRPLLVEELDGVAEDDEEGER